MPRLIKEPSIIQAAGTKPKRIDTPHLVISGNSETWTPTLLECQATLPTTRLRGNWDQEMAKCGATTHLPMVPRNCILFEIARAQRGRIVISAPNSLQLLCSQRRVPFFLDLVP